MLTPTNFLTGGLVLVVFGTLAWIIAGGVFRIEKGEQSVGTENSLQRWGLSIAGLFFGILGLFLIFLAVKESNVIGLSNQNNTIPDLPSPVSFMIEYEEIPPTDLRAHVGTTTTTERYLTQITTRDIGSQTVTALQAQNVELRSSQSQDGYTNLERSLFFMAAKPIRDKPISGVTAYVFIEPDETSRNQKIFCRFIAQYRLDTGSAEIYTSADKFVPVNQWHLLLWDLTGGLEATEKSWESDWSELSDNLGREGQHFTSLSRRLSEQLLYNAANEARGTGVANWQSRFEELGVQCFVSAHQLYGIGINPIFRGNIYLSNINTYPVDFTGSP